MLPIHVISLPGATARRERARREFAAQNIDFRFFDAVDGTRGASLFDRIDEEAFLLHTGRQPTPGELGCFASHKLLWQRCAEAGRPILVVEDDCKLAERFGQAVAVATRLVGELGLIRLQDERRGRRRVVMPYGGFVLERYTKTPHCSMCYALSPAIAARLVDTNSDLRAPVDVVMKQVWTFDNPMYCLTPYTVGDNCQIQRSTIGTRSKCARPAHVRTRRFLLKAGWQLRRLRFNLTRSDAWIRERFAGDAAAR